MRIKQHVSTILNEENSKQNLLGKIVTGGIIFMIVLSRFAMLLEISFKENKKVLDQ